MSVIISKFSILFLALIILSFSSDVPLNETDDLGYEILSCIEENNKEKLLDLLVTEKDLNASVDQSALNEQDKEKFKNQFALKLKEERAKLERSILQEFDAIVLTVNHRKTEVMSLSANSRPLDNLPTIELGDMQVNFRAKHKKIAFGVEIIRTVNGWRILEKLRLLR